MNRISITASNTMNQLQKQLDLISSNIANSQTNGYKSKNATFAELMYQQFNNPAAAENTVGRVTPYGVRIGSGSKIAQTQTNMAQGSILSTERMLDFAILNEHQYFKVANPDANVEKINYTRDGALYLSPLDNMASVLVTSEGHQVLDENNNAIIISGEINNMTLQSNGILTVTKDDGTTETIALGVVQVNRPQNLEQIGANLLTIPDELLDNPDIAVNLTGADRQQISIKQGALEQSNVNLAEEMTKLIQTQRAYQFQSRAITLADQMQGLINGIR